MEQFNLVLFLKSIWKWRKPVLITCGIAIVGSVVISDPHIMPPYFEASSSFYPLNPNLTSTGTLFAGGENYLFGGNNDVDRLLSIAGSPPLELYVVDRFKLFEHYKIDSAHTRYPMYSVLNELEDNYTYEKNERGAIVITVQDVDRNKAADMANAIVDKIDRINRDLLNENKKKILAIYQSKLGDKETEVKTITDSIFGLKQQYNLYTDISDLPSQISNSKGIQGAAYQSASEKVKVLEEKKKGAIRELNNNIVEFEQYKASINSEVPTLIVLDKAFPAERKSKPVRWLIVLGTTLVSFVLCALAILLIERFKAIKEVFKNAERQDR